MEESSEFDKGNEKKKENDRTFVPDPHASITWSGPSIETCKFKPKLCSVGASFLSCVQSAISHGEPDTNDLAAARLEAEEQDVKNSDQINRTDLKGETEQGTGNVAEGNHANQCLAEERSRRKERRDGQGDTVLDATGDIKDGCNWGSRERLGGSVEEDKEIEKLQMKRHRSKRWSRRLQRRVDSVLMGEEQTGNSGAEALPENRASFRCTILSRMLMHSSASSTSSFNCSSAESDDVFSGKEEAPASSSKLQDEGGRKKTRSWRTYLTVMQWSMRRQSSWVQLAGHAGNFCPSEGGEVLKRYNAVENSCLQALMQDSLRHFVPQYYGLASRGEERYIRLEDLLSGHTGPVVMDCKMGVRTYLEEELIKARQNPSLRSDMYQKMVKVDPLAPSMGEHKLKAVTKSRYMQWRDTMSSTSTLGFRIEGITMENGRVLRDFKMTRTLSEVTDALLTFTKKQPHLLKAYLSRLMALDEALKASEFFKAHEVIGSSLLFIHDRTSKANIWMIDFAKTLPAPSGVHLKHNVPWVEGSREDGYLFGLATLTSIVETALEQAQKRDLCSCSADDHKHSMQNRHQRVLLDHSTPMDTGLEDVFRGTRLESSTSGLQSVVQFPTAETALDCISAQPLHHNIIPELNFSSSLSPHKKFSLSG